MRASCKEGQPPLSSSVAGPWNQLLAAPCCIGTNYLRATKKEGSGSACSYGAATGFARLPAAAGTVWEVVPADPGVTYRADLLGAVVYIYTTSFPGCRLYLTAPDDPDNCYDSVTLAPLRKSGGTPYAQQWGLEAVEGTVRIFSRVRGWAGLVGAHSHAPAP